MKRLGHPTVHSQPNFDILWHAQLSPRLEESLRRREFIILLGGSTAFGCLGHAKLPLPRRPKAPLPALQGGRRVCRN